jgi:hypothetical protein
MKVRVKYEVYDLEGSFSMPLSDFINITEVPEELFPNTYRPITLNDVAEILRSLGAYVPDEPFLSDIGRAIDELELTWSGTNTYNWNWWGPTLDFAKIKISDNKTVVRIGVHLFGDVRTNYEWYWYLVSKPYEEVSILDIIGSLELRMLVEFEDGTTEYASCVDEEGARWQAGYDCPFVAENLNEILEAAPPWETPAEGVEIEIGGDDDEGEE